MKRGITKAESTLLTVWVPRAYFPIIERAVRKTDTDRSKFVRAAIREKLARHGIQLTEEAA
jgi:metal-responsive CopG/Arc/MetJ family transcriptional regulator